MPVAVIPCHRISDWETFHDIFAETLGFPAYYGRNMAAWVDCMTDVDDPTAGMVDTRFIAASGDVLTLELENADEFANRCPAQYDAVIESAAFVNWRRLEMGERAVLALSFRRDANS